MDNGKVGKLIEKLRKEKNLNQRELAEQLNISNKTVSKWERGNGAPDVAIWKSLSEVLGADILKLLQGELEENPKDIGKLDRINFYICPSCHNVITATSKASISCCGRKLDSQKLSSRKQNFDIKIEEIDQANLVTINHIMTKDNHILFAAYVYSDKCFLYRFYPEQNINFVLPDLRITAKLYIFSTKDGLSRFKIKDLID